MSLSPEAVDFSQLTPIAGAMPALSVEGAKSQARALLAAAETEAARIRDEAYASGFAAGTAEARASLAPSIDAMGQAFAAVRALEASVADRVEPQAVELAIQVAEKVVAGSLDVEPSRVLDVVQGALRTMIERERIVILVHPADLEFIRDSLPEYEVHEERRVPRGGAVVRTPLGEIDATVGTKLERAREAMLAELGAS